MLSSIRFACNKVATAWLPKTESEISHSHHAQEVLGPEIDFQSFHIFAFEDSVTSTGFVVSGARGSELA